jgi:pimeloyl-ACP methyl ester carboxylesterase
VNTPELNYSKYGDKGDAILMLHGWRRNQSDFISLAKIFASEFQVYTVDLPGFGQSSLVSEDWGTDEYVESVKAFIDSKEIKPILIGHSFGGRISLKLAAKYPQIVSSLILIGTPGLPQKYTLLKKSRLLLIKYLGRVFKFIDKIFRTKFFAENFSPRFGSRDYLAAGNLRKILVKTVNENLSEPASKISCPTLLLWGQLDNEAPIETASGYKQLIRNSQLCVLQQHSHDPHTDVGSHLCYKKIREFINAGV